MTPLTLFKQKQTQCERLLEFFRNGGKLTSFEAYTKFGITQLGRCISDLEGLGHQFNKPRVTLESGKSVCRYSLRRDCNGR